MNNHTLEELYDSLSNELSWRKRELYELRSIIEQYTSPSNIKPSRRNVVLRSTITMIYAHWEGFIKTSASAYLEFVAAQRLKNIELAPQFMALSTRPLLNNMFQSKKATDHIAVVDFFLNNMNDRSHIPYRDVINTESNLSSKVFENIVIMLGLDYSIFATKEKLIDDKLLYLRNSIAHGQHISVDYQSVRELLEQVISMMEQFRNQIDNAASTKSFKLVMK